ncbi:MAG: hypothetical protein JO165_01575 [Candidatus Eremiobacteraeota bacterium]|nr:hypothetical protein [Candidatus Eremiobacteraeota bacterium]
MESALSVFALLLSIFALLGSTANAYEFGTPKDRAAVRWDAQRLLARTVVEQRKTPADLVITDVVTDGDSALAVYHIGDYRGFMTLHKFWGQWWDMGDASLIMGGCYLRRGTPPVTVDSPNLMPFGFTDACLTKAGLPPAIIAEAQNIDVVRTANAVAKTYKANPDLKVLVLTHLDAYCFTVCGTRLQQKGGVITDPWANETGGYLTTMTYGRLQNTGSTQVKTFYGRAPTENESTQHPHGDAFYFFTFELAGTNPITFPAGTTLDVWFPHVLFPDLRYRITAGWGTKSFGPIRGTLVDNTLHFALPAFTLAPGDSMMYEIDGDP